MNSRKIKTARFYTLGCKVNQYETQEMRERFLEAGVSEAAKGAKADVYIINTCTVTQKADRESMNFIHRSRRENPGGLVVVTGCMADPGQKKAQRRAIKQAGADIIAANRDKSKIAGRVLKAYKIPPGGRRGITFLKKHTRAFLKVQDGCDNFCSYCIVPLVRGRSVSKPLSAIVKEVQALADNGYHEIVLTGICLGAYGHDLKPELSLASVIKAINLISGVTRVRLSSIEAGDVTDELIETMSGEPKFCRHLHIPIQSGDNEILRLMRRKYRREDYLCLVEKLKKAIPGISITTDVLIGFPGEKETNFANTMDLVKKIRPLRTHIFSYSCRPGTAACNLPEKVSDETVKDRHQRLLELSDACSRAYQKKFIGKTMLVLPEGVTKAGGQFREGYTDNYLKVRFKSGGCVRNRLIPMLLKAMERDVIYALPVLKK